MVGGVTGVLREAREAVEGAAADVEWRGWRRVRYPSEGVCAPWRWEREVAQGVAWQVWCDVNGRTCWAVVVGERRAHHTCGQADTEATARAELVRVTRQLALELTGAVLTAGGDDGQR